MSESLKKIADNTALMKIAKIMGYEVQPLTNKFNNLMVIMRGRCTIPFEYNPKTNPAQLLEIIEKFKPRIDWINKHLCQVTIYQHKQLPSLIKNEYEGRGGTLADAVLQAMIKIIEK